MLRWIAVAFATHIFTWGSAFAEDSPHAMHALAAESESFEDGLLRLAKGHDPSLALVATAGSAVAQVRVGQFSCTGFAISKTRVMTNQHCVKEQYWNLPRDPNKADDFDASACSMMTVRFGFQTANTELRTTYQYAPPPAIDVRCKKILLANMFHDVAIVELVSELPEAIVPLQLDAEFVPDRRNILHIGHPGGQPKRLFTNNIASTSAQSCNAIPLQFAGGQGPDGDQHPWHDAKNTHSFVHSCAGPGGSSGSPILDVLNMHVVGIHWNDSADCSWGHFADRSTPGARLDSRINQYFLPGSRAISMREILLFLAITP